MLSSIDLNCDLGESYGPSTSTAAQMRDRAIMPFLSSCNIACGFHSGDPLTIQQTIRLAMRHNVAIGAHPSYPDLQGFGRREMDLSVQEIEACVLYQVSAIKSMTEAMGGRLHHIKPHGALYNRAAVHEATAAGIVNAILQTSGITIHGKRAHASDESEILLYAPPRSVLFDMAKEAGIPVWREVFADRRYEDDLTLRSRNLRGAVLTSQDDVIAQLEGFLHGTVQTHGGKTVPIEADTLCLHSDTDGAAELARSIHDFFKRVDVDISASVDRTSQTYSDETNPDAINPSLKTKRPES